MPFDGMGNFNRLYSWQQDALNGIKIRADRMDNETNGIATGLSLCVTRDGQSPAEANLPMGGFKHTNVADATANNEYMTLGQAQGSHESFAVAGGTADALTAAFTPTIAALVDGMQLNVRALLANATTTPTIVVEAFAAHGITKLGGAALDIGDIGGPLHEMILRYNLANTRFELLNPAAGLVGTFTIVDISGGPAGLIGGSAGWWRKGNGVIDYWGKVGFNASVSGLPTAFNMDGIPTTSLNAGDEWPGATDYGGGSGTPGGAGIPTWCAVTKNTAHLILRKGGGTQLLNSDIGGYTMYINGSFPL